MQPQPVRFPCSRAGVSRLVGVQGFYCLWGLMNWAKGDRAGSTVFTHGFLCVACGFEHSLLATLSAVAVWLNFAVAAPAVLCWPAARLARVAKKTVVWGRVMKVYFVTNLLLWALTSFLLAMLTMAQATRTV